MSYANLFARWAPLVKSGVQGRSSRADDANPREQYYVLCTYGMSRNEGHYTPSTLSCLLLILSFLPSPSPRGTWSLELLGNDLRSGGRPSYQSLHRVFNRGFRPTSASYSSGKHLHGRSSYPYRCHEATPRYVRYLQVGVWACRVLNSTALQARPHRGSCKAKMRTNMERKRRHAPVNIYPLLITAQVNWQAWPTGSQAVRQSGSPLQGWWTPPPPPDPGVSDSSQASTGTTRRPLARAPSPLIPTMPLGLPRLARRGDSVGGFHPTNVAHSQDPCFSGTGSTSTLTSKTQNLQHPPTCRRVPRTWHHHHHTLRCH